MIPFATFLAGSLLSLLLPVLLLIALAVWYMRVVRRMPEERVPGAGLENVPGPDAAPKGTAPADTGPTT